MDHSTTQSVTALPAIAVSEKSKLFVSLWPSSQPGTTRPDSPVASDTADLKKQTLTFFGDYTESEDNADHSKIDVDKHETSGVLTFTGPLFVEGDFARFTATKVENTVEHNYDVTISIYGYRKVGLQTVALTAEFKGSGDIRIGEGAGVWHMAAKNPNI